MRVAILGPLEVDVDGEPVAVGGPRVRALLVRLALDAPVMVPIQTLHDALWSDAQPSGAANALHTLVSRLRRLLPDGAVVASAGAGYRLDVQPEHVDAHRFEVLAARGREAWAAGRPEEAHAYLTEALDLWRGAPLVDLIDADWVDAAVARLDELRLGALEDRIEVELALGRAVPTSELEALTAAHPLRERLQAAAITALYVAGRQSDALARYEETRARLADELGVDPGPQLQAAHLAVLRGEPVVAVPHAAAPRPPAHSNLRAWVSSFVGRSAEVERVTTLLSRSRLVTLVGPGGAGKTRLASESAARLSDQVPQGVWVAELASVSNPEDLPQTVLTALGVRGSGLLDPTSPVAERDVRARLIEALIDSETLLLLDNCEHLVDAVAELADLLADPLPRPPDPGHEPRGAGDRGRGALRRSLARPARVVGDRRGGAGLRRGPALLRPSRLAARRLRPRRDQRGAGGRDLPSPRRAPAGDRAGRRPDPVDARRRHRRPAQRPVPAAHRRQPYGSPTAPHPERGRRVELGPALRGRAAAGRAARRLPRRRHP